ncbi:DNA polymerase III subunit gamma/tau [Patescibacteria group bacterium]|nr:DNA polymerase III subunit gamma/tau [Patescibacteria group bacterium]
MSDTNLLFLKKKVTNLVLYRKYRPQNFFDVVGQEHIIKTLTNAITSGMISHAYLFDGPRGTGKTTVARLLSKAINCQDLKGSEPCNKCSSCLEITNNQSMDLIEIDAASHRGIDDIRELREGIKFAPSKLKYKVFIVDECHQLSKDASNALLKTLEEPPAHAIFILATTEIHKMIPTIISRCQRFNFRKLTIEEIIQRLEKIIKAEKVKIEKAALELIAIYSSGSIRDAESLLDQVLTFSNDSQKEIKAEDIKNILGLVEVEAISQLIDLIFQKKSSQAINFLNDVLEKGIDVSELIKAIVNYLRQGLILKITDVQENQSSIITGLTKEEFQNLKKQVAGLSDQQIQKILNSFLEASGKIKYSPIPQLPIELAIIESIEYLG